MQMGSITKRTTTAGEIKFRAVIRIRKQALPDFIESKTFSKKSLAETWIKKRELEIEVNPDLITGVKETKTGMSLAEAIDKYIAEVDIHSESKRHTLTYLKQWPISKIMLRFLRREHYAEHVALRRTANPDQKYKAIAASTALQELQFIRSVLTHADLVWNIEVNIFELTQATKGMMMSRQITKSDERDRLPTNIELQNLTNLSYERFSTGKYLMPIHLIMWLSIYTCRRLSELMRLDLRLYEQEHGVWQVEDVKNPNGSKGNNKYFKVSDDAKLIINELLQPEVRQRMLKKRGNEHYLIPLVAKSVSDEFRELCVMLNIEDLRFHDLRHEGATRLAEKGLTIPQMQEYTMHDSWDSLQRYVNLKFKRTIIDYSDAIVTSKNKAS